MPICLFHNESIQHKTRVSEKNSPVFRVIAVIAVIASPGTGPCPIGRRRSAGAPHKGQRWWRPGKMWIRSGNRLQGKPWKKTKQIYMIYVDLPHCSILWTSQLWKCGTPEMTFQNETSRAGMGRVGSRNTPASGWHKPGFLPSPPRLFKWSLANGRTTSIHEPVGGIPRRDWWIGVLWLVSTLWFHWCLYLWIIWNDIKCTML